MFRAPAPRLDASAITLGVFDGLHRGHQRLCARTRSAGDSRGIAAVALTLDPHPMSVLRPDRPVPLIMTVADRVAALRAAGMDHVVVIEFAEEVAALPAQAFVHRIHAQLRPQVFVAGPDLRFGRDAGGSAALLRELGGALGFEVVEEETVTVDGERISSTGLRKLLTSGDVGTAARWLGREFSVRGFVSSGAGRGRTLGVPTLNLRPPPTLLLAHGVYAVRAGVAGGAPRPAVANLGVRPTFDDATTAQPSLEVHVLDGAVSAGPGDPMEIAFVARLRGEERFDGPEALVARIAEDIKAARDHV